MNGRPYLLVAVLALAAVAVGCKPKIGDSCSISTDCSINGDRLCDTTQPGGYCTMFNCEPGTCPIDEAVCVAFYDTICQDPRATPRFERTFCMARCDDDSDCRGGYACIDMGANVIDLNPPTRKVCMVPPAPPTAGDAGASEAGSSVCGPPSDAGGWPDAIDLQDAPAGDGSDAGGDASSDATGDASTDAGGDASTDAASDALDDGAGSGG